MYIFYIQNCYSFVSDYIDISTSTSILTVLKGEPFNGFLGVFCFLVLPLAFLERRFSRRQKCTVVTVGHIISSSGGLIYSREGGYDGAVSSEQEDNGTRKASSVLSQKGRDRGKAAGQRPTVKNKMKKKQKNRRQLYPRQFGLFLPV